MITLNMVKSNLFASLKSWRNSCLVLAGNVLKMDLSFCTFQSIKLHVSMLGSDWLRQ